MSKPTVSVYPSPVRCDHAVLIGAVGSKGYRLARWFYKGVQRANIWLISPDESDDSIKHRMRQHHPCDVGFVRNKEPDL